MKLGWIGRGLDNKIIDPKPLAETPFSTGPQGMFARLYPDEDSAVVGLDNPDYDLLVHMDAVLYMSGCVTDEDMLKVIDKIPCKVLSYHEGGEHDFLRFPLNAVLVNREVMNKSDLVLVWDTRALGLHRLYTTTKILWWPLPYPVEQVNDVLVNMSNVPEYDIIISYSPTMSHRRPSNGIAGCLLAQNLIDNIGYYKTAATFSYVKKEEDLIKDVEFLQAIECLDIEPLGYVTPRQYLAILSKAKLGINLDRRRASGRFSLECAYVRTPVIATDQQPFAYQVYNGIRLHDIFDIDSMIDTARLVADGRWHKEWFDLAYERALHYSYTRKARVLERAVAKL